MCACREKVSRCARLVSLERKFQGVLDLLIFREKVSLEKASRCARVSLLQGVLGLYL